MQHSIKNIGDNYEKLSALRNDKRKFIAKDFFDFAKCERVKNKYKIIENDDDLLVSTWYSDSLINEFISTLNKV